MPFLISFGRILKITRSHITNALSALVVLMMLSFDGVETTFKEYYVYPQDETNQVKVTWMTHSGENVRRFELEKSKDNRNYIAWKKLMVGGSLKDNQKFLEVDFDPYQGWSYYRLKEITNNGENYYSHIVPVFIGIKNLQKGVRIVAKSIVENDRQEVTLTDYDNKMAILVMRDKNGDEFLYDKIIHANEQGLYIQKTKSLPVGEYVITASSINELNGLSITVK